MPQLETIIGLEVHAQIGTNTKLFCGCKRDSFGAEPNTTVCPVCMGHPGSLPVPSGEAIRKAVIASLALRCTIADQCHFDRKHYFYPDLPSGFQISQYDFPLATKGEVLYDIIDHSGRVTESRTCVIHRLHVENDAGKLTHRGSSTLCDYNRAGTALMEIVTEPDLRNAEQAVAFAQELRRILIAVGASDADMFKGEMRFDASISLREIGTEKLNPRSEIKNLNSFKSLEKALQFEEKRLRALWEETGGPLKGNITVGWMDDSEQTRMLRDKEDAQDYRYFPEPDIPPIICDKAMVEALRAGLPPLPREQREHYRALGLDDAQAMQLLDDETLRAMFDGIHAKTGDARRASSLVLTQLMGFLRAGEKTIEQAPSLDAMLELVAAIDGGTISANAGKQVLEAMVATGKRPADVIHELGLEQINDVSAVDDLAKRALAANADAAANFKAGKASAFGAIVGWAMKESKGKVNPVQLNEALRKLLA